MSAGSIKLSCTVEIDEAYIGGKESNKHESKKLNQGRGSVGKTAVMGIKERSGKVVAQVVEMLIRLLRNLSSSRMSLQMQQ